MVEIYLYMYSWLLVRTDVAVYAYNSISYCPSMSIRVQMIFFLFKKFNVVVVVVVGALAVPRSRDS